MQDKKYSDFIISGLKQSNIWTVFPLWCKVYIEVLPGKWKILSTEENRFLERQSSYASQYLMTSNDLF